MEDEILQEFVVESTEALDSLDVELVELEEDPSSTATLSSIFRRVHTIKGTCGFLGFSKLEGVTHVGENLLSKLRDGEMTATPEIVSTLLDLVDAMREMMNLIVSTGAEGDGDYSALLARLSALTNGEALPAADDVHEPEVAVVAEEPEVAEAAEVPQAEVTDEVLEAPGAEMAEDEVDEDVVAETVVAEAEVAEAVSSTDDEGSWTDKLGDVRLGDLLVEAGKIAKGDVDRALARQQEGDPRHIGEILVGWGLVTPDEALAAIEQQHQQQSAAMPGAGPVGETSIRVDVTLLDSLMNLVGELVLNRNQILQHTKETSDAALVATLQRLDLITTELQGSVMQTRMQPIENAWAKYPRVVRDLAKLCGKEVNLEMHGKETELDKTLLEAIKDPLTHIVRNSIDHGIEAPEIRVARGKPRKGVLSLRAYHESGQVIIEIADDGGGIDPRRVRDLAVARGVITEARAEKMSRREMTELIFAPGFSTAEAVSNISGRGVGMDVVRTNIEAIGGTVDLASELGEGTTLRVKIPLTLAIIPALVVRSVGQKFAIPQVSLLELVRLQGSEQIEDVHGSPVYRLRGKLLPLVFLNQQLSPEPVAASGDHIVVLQYGEKTFGLVVDHVEDTAEIVVKPLGKQLRDVGVFAGATIMGDGHVALILDVVGIATKAGLSNDTTETSTREVDDDMLDGEAQTLLLFKLGSERTFALPLSQVSRLEEFQPSTVERSGMNDVVQYRDHILPLCHVADVLEAGIRPQPEEGAPIRVIVFSRGEQDIGLVVGEISDIVHQRLTVTREVDVPGLSGSAVIDGVVTDVVDVESLLVRLGLHLPAMA